MKIKIGDRTISKENEMYVIAEIGVNHNGSVETAKKLIELAKDANADAVKFQMFHTEEMVSDFADLADYQKNQKNKNQKEMLKKLELTEQQFKELKAYSEQLGITFLSTPFDIRSAEILNQMDVKAFKVGSGDLTNLPLLHQIASYKKPIILSTGMSTLSEIETTLNFLPENSEVALLQCTSAYPAPFEDLNLKVIDTLEYSFQRIIGYSDHSLGLEIPFAVTSMGYKILEKHFTFDKQAEGPDHRTSLEPIEFKKMVEGIRHIEKALGTSEKKVTKSELKTKPLVRKGIYLQKDLEPGHPISLNDLLFLRPLSEINAEQYLQVLGKRLRTTKKSGQPLLWNDIQ